MTSVAHTLTFRYYTNLEGKPHLYSIGESDRYGQIANIHIYKKTSKSDSEVGKIEIPLDSTKKVVPSASSFPATENYTWC